MSYASDKGQICGLRYAGVVYNAHYLTFIDDAFDCWMRELAWDFEKELETEIMLKSANITWHKPVGFRGDLLMSQVTRWGNSSFDISTDGFVLSEHCFEASISYVCVDHINYRPIEIPELLKIICIQSRGGIPSYGKIMKILGTKRIS